MGAAPRITRAVADEYMAAVAAHVSAKIADSNGSSDARKVIGGILGLLKIVDAAEWLAKFSFTLACFIFLAPGLDPVQTVFVLAHEAQHVHQWWKKTLMFVVIYVQSEGRMALEGEAYTTTGECFWMFYGNKGIPHPDDLTRSIPVAYALDAGETKSCRLMVEQGVSACPEVGPTTALGRWTWEWFATNHPELLHPDALALWNAQNGHLAPATEG